MDRQSELDFAKSVVELGYVTPDQLRECLSIQLGEQQESARLKPGPDGTAIRAGARPLSAILIEKGYLTQEALTEIRDRQSVARAAPATDDPALAPRRPPSPIRRAPSGSRPSVEAHRSDI